MLAGLSRPGGEVRFKHLEQGIVDQIHRHSK